MMIYQDRVSGASEIEKAAMHYLKKGFDNIEELKRRCFTLLSTYPSFGSLWNLINSVFLYGNDVDKIIKQMSKINSDIVAEGVKYIQDNALILSYSRSSTVRDILQYCHGKNISVIISEGRPRYEGRVLSKELVGDGINTTLTTDAGLYSYVDKVDMVIIGADAILRSDIVNKSGTQAITAKAKESGIAVYVAAATTKVFPFIFMKAEKEREIWKTPPEHLKIDNTYFDVTPIENISYFVTEKGRTKKSQMFTEKLSEHTMEIKQALSSIYRMVE